MRTSDWCFQRWTSPIKRVAKSCLFVCLCLFAIDTSLAQTGAPGESSTQATSDSATEGAGLQAFSATGIADQAISSKALRRDAEDLIADDDSFEKIKDEFEIV